MRESRQEQLAVAVPVGEETARPARWRRATLRLVSVVAIATLTVGLCWLYLLQSRTQSANSDAVGQVLQGWDMMHGNWLLRGWALSDVSFYTFEVPLDGVISLVYGLRVDVVHVSAAIEYALLVLLAALLAAGKASDRRRGGREAWVRALIAAGIMVAPAAVPAAHVLLLAPDHTGIGVPVLATLLLVDRMRPKRWLAVIGTALLVCLLLMWGQLDDPVAEFGGALPLALACAAPLAATPFRRLAARIRRWRGRDRTPPLRWRGELARHGYDLALVVAAAASFALTQLLVREINQAGGFYLHSIVGGVRISGWGPVGTQLSALGQNLMFLFGSNFWITPQVLTDYAYLHLVGIALALLGLLIAICRWPRADRVTRTLVLAILIVLAAGAVSPLMQPVSGTHEIAIVLGLSAALAGRGIGPWLAGRRPARQVAPVAQAAPVARAALIAKTDQISEIREADAASETSETASRLIGETSETSEAASAASRPGWRARVGSTVRVAAACLLIVAGAGYVVNLGYNARQPAAGAVNQVLANWLVAHHLTSGISGYWDANITALASGGRVSIAPVVDGASYGYLWESKPSWYDPDVSSANFVIAHTQQLGAGYVYLISALDWFGLPVETHYFGDTVVLVYNSNLLSSLIQPVESGLNNPPLGQ